MAGAQIGACLLGPLVLASSYAPTKPPGSVLPYQTGWEPLPSGAAMPGLPFQVCTAHVVRVPCAYLCPNRRMPHSSRRALRCLPWVGQPQPPAVLRQTRTHHSPIPTAHPGSAHPWSHQRSCRTKALNCVRTEYPMLKLRRNPLAQSALLGDLKKATAVGKLFVPGVT